MRGTGRGARALGACAVALLSVLSTPGSAQAAHGVLRIDGAAHRDPSGCLPLGDFAPSEVINLTDTPAHVWSGPFCDGRVTAVVLPGQALRPAPGMSLFIE
ncbi:hypothetical protein ACN20G_27745 (plasmid) [Streptomyces sp. BI20]|uniref:hypothetical protein n=1 Tax=Streptomyces sp. BI20 TaxID=3403460 RepID=UPI003C73CDF7